MTNPTNPHKFDWQTPNGISFAEYRKTQEFMERMKEHMKEYFQKPEVRERMKEYMKEYNQKPEVRERIRERRKERRNRPETIDRRDNHANAVEYRQLLSLKKRTQRQTIRLGVLAEILGRETEELRTHEENQRHAELLEGI